LHNKGLNEKTTGVSVTWDSFALFGTEMQLSQNTLMVWIAEK